MASSKPKPKPLYDNEVLQALALKLPKSRNEILELIDPTMVRHYWVTTMGRFPPYYHNDYHQRLRLTILKCIDRYKPTEGSLLSTWITNHLNYAFKSFVIYMQKRSDGFTGYHPTTEENPDGDDPITYTSIDTHEIAGEEQEYPITLAYLLHDLDLPDDELINRLKEKTLADIILSDGSVSKLGFTPQQWNSIKAIIREKYAKR
jgi:hypothetical protein